MKNYRSIGLLICLTFIPFTVLAQSKKVGKTKPKGELIQNIDEAPSPPPPRAAIDARLKEFDSEESGFKIKVPGTPRKSVTTVDTGIGQINLTQYSVVGNTASYFVACMDLPAPVIDPLELRVRYDSGRDNILKKSPGSSLVDEKDVYFGDHYGREFVIDKIDSTSTVRMFLIQQRLFQLIVITPRLSKAPESIQNNYRKTIESFFNSFIVTNIPASTAQVPELPSDFGLKIEGTNFSSEFFGFSLTLPQEWNKPTPEELEFINKSGDTSMSKKSQSVKDQIELSVKNSKNLLTITKLPIGTEENASISVIAERVAFTGFIPQKILKMSTERLYVGQLGLQITKPVESVKLDGVDSAQVGLVNPINAAKVRIYMTNRKDIALELVFSYASDEDLATFEKLLQTIKFK